MDEQNLWDTDINIDPFVMFGRWMNKAEKIEQDPANVAAVASADSSGQPSVRIMLLKGIDDNGFIFFTNFNSKKGQDFTNNPKAAFNLFWKRLGRQVCVRGIIENISKEMSDEYFQSRPRGSQIASAVSKQSSRLKDRQEFLEATDAMEKKYEGKEIPRPKHWHGFRIVPHYIEFFDDAEYRMHKRRAFTRENIHDNKWVSTLLYP